jgi:NAD(P)-dependent dehydrogenase (short-subunit alcohol dehydrogenase family)
VTVNTISPGYIGTKMVMAIPQEVLESKILPPDSDESASASRKKSPAWWPTWRPTRRPS